MERELLGNILQFRFIHSSTEILRLVFLENPSSMYLSNLSIKNFRNFKDLNMDFAPGLNVIVGENNIGKTNLFDAIRIALGGQSNQGEFVRATKDDLSKDKFGNTLSNSFQISLVFVGLDEDERGELIDILELNSSDVASSRASVHFQWTWSEELNRGSYRRWGGARTNTDTMPDDVLQSIQITLLKALRDAQSGLQPGRTSQLGRLLRVLAKSEQKEAVENIVTRANNELRENPLIQEVTKTIQASLTSASGNVLSQKASINTSSADFDRISNNLRIAIQRPKENEDAKLVLEELWSNGLGYNNLLFIATVLSELEAAKDASLAVLLVEEPEAHLHPQLQTLLADYLAKTHTPENDKHSVQTFVTTHSPTIAAHVDPNTLVVLHRSLTDEIKSTSIRSCELTPKERKQLQRMLDVTKATMLFARGIILVEGISEAILLPVLAKREELRITDYATSVIPMCGVDFRTFGKLFSTDRIAIKVSIITDGDPKIIDADVVNKPTESEAAGDDLLGQNDEDEEPVDPKWQIKLPSKTDEEYVPCKRTQSLLKEFDGNNCVAVFHSDVTLEFDLADAGPENVGYMCEAWHDCFNGNPRTFNRKILEECGDNHDNRVLAAWRGICIATPKTGKPEFAQALAMRLDEKDDDGKFKVTVEQFIPPKYIKDALLYANS